MPAIRRAELCSSCLLQVGLACFETAMTEFDRWQSRRLRKGFCVDLTQNLKEADRKDGAFPSLTLTLKQPVVA